MKHNWREIKITDLLFTISVMLICFICCSAMTFIMPFRIYMIGIFGACLYIRAFMKNLNLNKSPIVILLTVFIGLCFISLLYTLDRVETVKYSLVYFCLLPMIIFEMEGGFFTKALKIMKIIVFVVAITIILNAAFPNLFLTTLNFLIKPGLNKWIEIEVMNSIYSGMAGEKGEAAILMMIGVAIKISDLVKKKKIEGIDIIYAAVIVIALILPAKRMFFATSILLIVFYIIFWTTRNRKAIAIAAGMTIATFAILFAEYIPGMSVLLARFMEGKEDDSFNGRSYLWERAIQMFHNKPAFGYGYGSYNTFASIYGVKTSATGDWAYHAHNVYLQLLAEMGIIGASCMYLVMISSILVTAVIHIKKKNLKAEDLSILAFVECMLIYSTINDVMGNSLYNTNHISIYLFTLAGVVYLAEKTRKRGNIIEN